MSHGAAWESGFRKRKQQELPDQASTWCQYDKGGEVLLNILGAGQRGMGVTGGAADPFDLCRHYKDLALTQMEIKIH